KRTKYGAWIELTPSMVANKDFMNRLFADQAKTSGETASISRRLMALRKREAAPNGEQEVVVVSAYPYGHDQINIREPSGGTGVAGMPHVNLERVLKDWEPIDAILLDSPRQGFYKRYRSYSDWIQNGRAGDARDIGKRYVPAVRAQTSTETGGLDAETGRTISKAFMENEMAGVQNLPGLMEELWARNEAEGTPGIRQGGFAQGPEADLLRIQEAGERPGSGLAMARRAVAKTAISGEEI